MRKKDKYTPNNKTTGKCSFNVFLSKCMYNYSACTFHVTVLFSKGLNTHNNINAWKIIKRRQKN